MPQEVFKVSDIVGKDKVEVEDFNRLVTELNKVLSEIGVAIGRTKGRDGAVSIFANDLNLSGNDINNVGRIRFGARQHAESTQPFTGEFNVDEPTDNPASSDALRDDLAENILPDIEVALNVLGKEVRRILDVLQI